MTTYLAWDGKEYPKPTPDGWYLAVDGRWWPPGYGPGPDEGAAAESMPAGEAAFTPPLTHGEPAAQTPPSATGESSPVDRPPADGSANSESSGGSGAKRGVIAVVVAALVLAVGAGVVALRSGDDSASSTGVGQPETETTDTTDAAIAEEAETDDASSETTEPGPTTTTVPGKGSAEDPYEIGDTIRLAYTDVTEQAERVWEIEVLGPAVDRTEDVLAENQFNEPPAEGFRFVVAPIKVTYVSGPQPASLFDLNFKAVGPSAVVLTTFDPSCGVVPGGLDTLAEVLPGGELEGNICWVARPTDIGDLTMLIEVFLVEGDTYVRLQ